jgi:hypothetical protein
MIPGFARDVDEICALLPYYAASSGNFLPTFRVSLSVQFSWVKKSKNDFLDFLVFEDVETSIKITTRRRVMSEKSADFFKSDEVWEDVGLSSRRL